MSVRWITWAWEQECANAAEKLTLLALADHAGEDGKCWPASGRLAEKTGQGRSTILRHMGALTDRGVIWREQRFREDGSQTSSMVTLGGPDPGRGGVNGETGGCVMGETGGVSPVSAQNRHMNRQIEPSSSKSIIVDDFERFWTLYGRIGPKKVARECWARALRKTDGDPAPILSGLEEWVEYWKQPGAASMKWPQGWLNEERWTCSPPAPPPSRSGMSLGGQSLMRIMNRKAGER